MVAPLWELPVGRFLHRSLRPSKGPQLRLPPYSKPPPRPHLPPSPFRVSFSEFCEMRDETLVLNCVRLGRFRLIFSWLFSHEHNAQRLCRIDLLPLNAGVVEDERASINNSGDVTGEAANHRDYGSNVNSALLPSPVSEATNDTLDGLHLNNGYQVRWSVVLTSIVLCGVTTICKHDFTWLMSFFCDVRTLSTPLRWKMTNEIYIYTPKNRAIDHKLLPLYVN